MGGECKGWIDYRWALIRILSGKTGLYGICIHITANDSFNISKLKDGFDGKNWDFLRC